MCCPIVFTSCAANADILYSIVNSYFVIIFFVYKSMAIQSWDMFVETPCTLIDYKHTGYDNNYKINLAISFLGLVDWHVLNSVNNKR
jgi:hypothetical protein